MSVTTQSGSAQQYVSSGQQCVTGSWRNKEICSECVMCLGALTHTKPQESYFVFVYFDQDTYQHLINPIARRIYPVNAYLVQLLFLKLYFTTTYARICLFCAFTFVFFVIFMTWYDEALHCPSQRRNTFSLINQLTLDKHVFKTKLQLPQSFSNVTEV